MADFLDKFLIFLLILILPITIFLSNKAYKEEIQGGENGLGQDKLEQVDQAIQQLETQLDNKINSQQAKKTNPIKITDVSFASSSAELRVFGIAPTKNLNVMVSAIVTPKGGFTTEYQKEKIGTKSSSLVEPVLGQAVEVIAVRTDGDGHFEFAQKVDIKKVDLIELRFDQGDSSVTVQYSIRDNTRTL
jgi:hypothetical protein